MNPEQALSLLDSLVSQANLTRAQHGNVIIAVNTLKAAINPKETPDAA